MGKSTYGCWIFDEWIFKNNNGNNTILVIWKAIEVTFASLQTESMDPMRLNQLSPKDFPPGATNWADLQMPGLPLPVGRMVSITSKAEALRASGQQSRGNGPRSISCRFAKFRWKMKRARVTFQGLTPSLPLTTWCSLPPRLLHSVAPRGLDYYCSSPAPAAALNSRRQPTCVQRCGSEGQGGQRGRLHPARYRHVNRKGIRVTYCAWKGKGGSGMKTHLIRSWN